MTDRVVFILCVFCFLLDIEYRTTLTDVKATGLCYLVEMVQREREKNNH